MSGSPCLPHAQDDRVGDPERLRVRRRGEAVGLRHRLHEVGAQVLQVRVAAPQHLDLLVVDVEADDAEAGLKEGAQQRQADVAEADDADGRGAIVDPGFELGGGGRRSGHEGRWCNAVPGSGPARRVARRCCGPPAPAATIRR